MRRQQREKFPVGARSRVDSNGFTDNCQTRKRAIHIGLTGCQSDHYFRPAGANVVPVRRLQNRLVSCEVDSLTANDVPKTCHYCFYIFFPAGYHHGSKRPQDRQERRASHDRGSRYNPAGKGPLQVAHDQQIRQLILASAFIWWVRELLLLPNNNWWPCCAVNRP